MTGTKYKQTEETLTATLWEAPQAVEREATSRSQSKFGRAWGWTALHRELAACWAVCGAYEWWALGYLCVSSLLIGLFAENLRHPWYLLGINAAVALAVLLLCRVEASFSARAEIAGPSFASRWWHFWRHWYPHLFFLYCFEQLAYLMKLVTAHWQDAKLIAFDFWLTGVDPTIWLEQFVTPARNEVMQLAYLTYFVYLVVLGGILYYRREWYAYWSVMTYSMIGYSIGYLTAIFFPIESPWFSMAGSWHTPLSGGPITATINFIEHYGRVRGAAFPSEHVAGSVAVLWGAWKFRTWLFWIMLPMVALMCASTIWGRYHYVADIFGGIVTGTLGYVIGRWLMQRRGAMSTIAKRGSVR
jgi:hypothetical protein